VQQNVHLDPAEWLRLYGGCERRVGFTGWCPEDTNFDELLEQSTATFDQDERIAILKEANAMEMEAYVVLPYVFMQTLHTWNADKLGDYVPSFTGGYNYLYLQPQGD
jgi:ABC-type transport system substrate-binding protein